MTINLKFKSLIAVALLSGLSSFAAADAEENNGLAPEATAADAELSFWDIPILEMGYRIMSIVPSRSRPDRQRCSAGRQRRLLPAR